MIPLFKVYISPKVHAPVSEVLNSGYLTQGPQVEQFEYLLRRNLDVSQVLTVNSATSGLQLAASLAGLGPSNYAISTAMTCTASNTAILSTGANIIWADIDPKIGNLTPESVEYVLKRYHNRYNIKAVMCVDWAGVPCDYDGIFEVTSKYGVKIIRDAAHAWGATYKGVFIPSNVDYTVYSFQAIKHLTTGDGGALICQDHHDHNLGKKLRWYGIDRETPRKDMRCIHPDSSVLMADGKRIPIRDVVKNKMSGPILAFENESLVPKKIVAWYKNPLNGRKFVQITTKRLSPRYKTIVTDDHKLLTANRGWVEAQNLKENELIATSFLKPNEKQEVLIIGSLLGDAGISSKTKSNRGVLYESHTARQSEYTLLKVQGLQPLNLSVVKTPPDVKSRRPFGALGYASPSLPYLGELREKFYSEGKKIVPKDLVLYALSKNMPLFLATWYMDDGSITLQNTKERIKYSAQIATNCFTKDEVTWLTEILIKKGLECNCLGNDLVGWRIHFTQKSTDKLFKLIDVYVPECLRYKLGHNPQLRQFQNELWELGSAKTYYDHVLLESCNRKGGISKNFSVYCLGIEDDVQNFTTSAVIVHNCEIDVEQAGWKYHMNDLNATIGIHQISDSEELVTIHKTNGQYYDKVFSEISGDHLDVPIKYYDKNIYKSSYWVYTILVRQPEIMKERLWNDGGIQASKVHSRNDTQTMLKNAVAGTSLEGLDTFYDKQINIPCGWWVSEKDVKEIAKLVTEISEVI